MKNKKVDKHYVSEIDKRLTAFRQTQKLSASQQAEIKKYQRIYLLRDHPDAQDQQQTDTLWD